MRASALVGAILAF